MNRFAVVHVRTSCSCENSCVRTHCLENTDSWPRKTNTPIDLKISTRYSYLRHIFYYTSKSRARKFRIWKEKINTDMTEHYMCLYLSHDPCLGGWWPYCMKKDVPKTNSPTPPLPRLIVYSRRLKMLLKCCCINLKKCAHRCTKTVIRKTWITQRSNSCCRTDDPRNVLTRRSEMNLPLSPRRKRLTTARTVPQQVYIYIYIT